ncbi:MAG: hypothetical protein IT356_12790 [Gemmatimonadaceae bacterium]|nr:hypothetical protein [Gemmatimonadaceae bacterium]
MELKETIQKYAEQPIVRHVLLSLLKDYKRPYDKINELVKQKILMPVKRGIYIPGPNLNMAPPEPFLLANHLLGPSYVSMDSALSYWGFIPEKVFEVSSATIKSHKFYDTPIGRFSYISLPLPYYSFGIQKVALTKKQIILIASPEKALCDKIITTSGILLRSSKQAIEYLTEDLRIDEQALRKLNVAAINDWIIDAPKKESLNILITALKKL